MLRARKKYDFVNCVGVLHHLPDPNRGLRALASRMKDGALMHIFVYSALGRREIMLMQEALALLQGGKVCIYIYIYRYRYRDIDIYIDIDIEI